MRPFRCVTPWNGETGKQPALLNPAARECRGRRSIHGQAQAALEEYQAVLKVAPNRFNALYGAASAAETAGNATLANQLFQKLTEIAVGEERPELVAARRKVAAIAQVAQ